MHREGIDDNNVQPEDILCDFCGNTAWANDVPCVEGHQGSIVCGNCLTVAYTELVLAEEGASTEETCRMCLEHREDPVWAGAVEPIALICQRCTKMAAAALNKSKTWEWSKPVL
jgi:hypothetical protein